MSYDNMTLHEIEETNVGNALVCHLVSRIRSLEHQARDPNYLYSGDRIHRQALISRDKELTDLRNKIRQLYEAYDSANSVEFLGSDVAEAIKEVLK